MTRVRRSVAVLAVLALSAPVALVVPSADAATATPRPIVSGWGYFQSPSAASVTSVTANADLFSDVSPFWYQATWDGTAPRVTTNGTYAANKDYVLPTLKATGVPVIPAVVDGTSKGVMATILGDATKRGLLVAQLVALAVDNGFDGVDLDFEGFAFTDGRASWPTTKPRWQTFVTELSAAMHAQGKLLAITTPPIYDSQETDTSGYWVYDWAGIASSVDRLRVMTYDYSVSGGNIAPFPWVEKVVAFAVTQVPSTKIQVGVPAYGRNAYKSVVGTCPVAMPSDWNRVVSFSAANAAGALPLAGPTSSQFQTTTLARTQAVRTWSTTYQEYSFNYQITYTGLDANGKSTKCTTTRAGWYDEAKAAVARAQLVGKYRLRGIAQWTVGGEDAAQWSPLRDYAISIAPASTKVSISAPSVVTYGKTATVKASLLAGASPLSGVTARLWSRPWGGSAWTSRATAASSSSGAVSFAPLVVMRPTEWRVTVYSAWDHTYGAATAATKVRQVMAFWQSATSISSGTYVRVQARMTPAIKGQKVLRQLYSSGKWTTVATAYADADGKVSFAFDPTTRGKTYHYRLVAVSTSTILGVIRPFDVKVT